MMDEGMNNIEPCEHRARDAKRLDILIAYRGRERVREMLGIDDPTLDGLLSGSGDWPQGAWDRFQRALDNFQRVGHPVEVDDDVLPGKVEEADMTPDDATEGAEETDNSVQDVAGPHAVNGSSDGPGEADMAAGDIRAPQWRYESLWKVRDLGISRYLRRDVPDHKQLAALQVVIAMEMALIFGWKELPTEPGLRCDDALLNRAFEIRSQYQTVIRRVLDGMHGGFGGLVGWVLGRGPVNIKKLEYDLFAEANKMGQGYTPRPVICLIDPDDFVHTHRLVRTFFSWHRLKP